MPMWLTLLQPLITGFVVLVLFRIAGFFISRIAHAMLSGRVYPELADLVARLVRTMMNVVGIICALGTMGVNVLAMVAVVGLVGFALGIALRDVLANVVSGLMILVYRPFTIDDTISINDMHGTVRQIDLRYTQLQAAGERILIPNSHIFNSAVTVVRNA